MMMRLLFFCAFFTIAFPDDSYISYDYWVPCDEDYIPKNCNYPNITLEVIKAVEDFDRCAPAVLPKRVRNLYWAAAGRKHTYERNFQSLRKVVIIPRMLRDVSQNSMRVTLLGIPVEMPIGISPTSAHPLANPVGESGTAMAAAEYMVPFVMSSSSLTSLEDIANAAFQVNKNAILWAETYIMVDRAEVVEYIRRAENSGFKAIIVTIDSPLDGDDSCNGKSIYGELKYPNLRGFDFPDSKLDASLTYDDLAWLVQSTKLPVVAKGVLRPDDAVRAVDAGAAAIWVSNQGGRQMDGEISTVEALVDIVEMMKMMKYKYPDYPNVEIYIDGGIRSGYDVFKVLSIGATAAFVGRPALWGLAIAGKEGVSKMLDLMKIEFHKAMMIAGYSNPYEIDRSAVRLPTERPGWN